MTTKESNRLILDFMGIKPSLDAHGYYVYSDMPWFSVRHDNFEDAMDAIAVYAKYHEKWDWLMPVVERIEAIGFPVDIFGKAVSIHKQDGEPIIDFSGASYENKMSAVYNAVVLFTVWFDKNY